MKQRQLGFPVVMQYGLAGLVLSQTVALITLGLYAFEKDQLSDFSYYEKLLSIDNDIDVQLSMLDELLNKYHNKNTSQPKGIKTKEVRNNFHLSVVKVGSSEKTYNQPLNEYEELAENFMVNSKWSQAAEVYRKLLSLKKAPAYQYNLGICLDNLSIEDEAIATYTKLIDYCSSEDCPINLDAVKKRLLVLNS